MTIYDPIASLLGPWSKELHWYTILLRITLSVLLSAVIGWERSSKRHSAGLRTFILVSLTTTLTMLLDQFLAVQMGQPLFVLSGAAIIAASIISIHSILFSSRSQIKGLTTTAALWNMGLIGLASGAGFYTIMCFGFVAVYCVLSVFPALEISLKDHSNHFEIHLELTNSSYLKDFITVIRKLGLIIDDIEFNTAYTGSGLSVYTIALSIQNKDLKQYKTHAEIIEALSTLEYIYHIEEIKM
ncbi:MAG: MgtC/SapB family protein [Firmicutes bacterium]|nr:MgtC/SapB family protein [Bacillota bacterium]